MASAIIQSSIVLPANSLDNIGKDRRLFICYFPVYGELVFSIISVEFSVLLLIEIDV
jgi:hypothetical protein